MGEVPEAERAIFTLSVGFAASSPRVGAKGERIVTEGNPQGEHQRLPLLTKGSLCITGRIFAGPMSSIGPYKF